METPKTTPDKALLTEGLHHRTFMPFFYGDPNRTYTIIPGWYPVTDDRDGPQLDPTLEKTYSDLYTLIDDAYNLAVKWLTVFANDPGMGVTNLLQV